MATFVLCYFRLSCFSGKKMWRQEYIGIVISPSSLWHIVYVVCMGVCVTGRENFQLQKVAIRETSENMQ